MSIVRSAAIQTIDCPYCHSRSSILTSFQAVTISADDFGQLLEAGWCRCGSLIYRPDPDLRCCPQYSMRIRTGEYAAPRRHRRLVRQLGAQAEVRDLGQRLDAALRALHLVRAGTVQWPYPPWFLRNSDGGALRSDVVATLSAAVCQGGGGAKVRDQLHHVIVHQLLRQSGGGVALASLTFDGSGRIFLSPSPGTCSFCDCGADDPDDRWADCIVTADNVDPLRPYWDTIRIDADVLDKWESTGTRTPRLRTVPSSRCRRHDRHRTPAPPDPVPSPRLFDRVDAHLSVSMEPCSFTEEKYQLYLQYQVTVHQDGYDLPSRGKFTDSMARSPIRSTESEYGTFHRCYRRKDTGELIAFTLLDVVPSGVNSQYFVWSQAWRQLSLGIISVLDEIDLVESSRHHIQPYLYIGIYVETCAKMTYKRQFRPSELRTPCGWIPTEAALGAERRRGDAAWLRSVLERDHIPLESICADMLVRLDGQIQTFGQFRRRVRFTFEQLHELYLFTQYVGDLAPNFVYILS